MQALASSLPVTGLHLQWLLHTKLGMDFLSLLRPLRCSEGAVSSFVTEVLCSNSTAATRWLGPPRALAPTRGRLLQHITCQNTYVFLPNELRAKQSSKLAQQSPTNGTCCMLNQRRLPRSRRAAAPGKHTPPPVNSTLQSSAAL